jgi:hypothetical protein
VHRKISYALISMTARHRPSHQWRSQTHGGRPHLNFRVQAAFRCYSNKLIRKDNLADDRVRFRAITLETVIDAIHQSGAATLVKQRWARYCDFVW